MKISRRQFLTLLGASSATAAVGIPLQSLALPAGAKKVIWLIGSACSGCSVSFLNRIATVAPQTAGDVLLDIVEVDFHQALMVASGELAVSASEAVFLAGGYLLVIEGGIPTSFAGRACWVWSRNGVDIPFQDVVRRYASRAAGIICLGNCASWGGVPSAYPNPTGVKGVKALTGLNTINVPGCPPHPDWFIWVVAQVLAGANIALDGSGRPTALFGRTVHSQCPRRGREEAETFGVDNECLIELGCKGPSTMAGCPVGKWNGAVNWCADSNAPCIGCAEPSFPLSGLMGPGTGGD